MPGRHTLKTSAGVFRIYELSPVPSGVALVYDPPSRMEQVEPNLKVTDRRQFTADGELKADTPHPAPEEHPSEPSRPGPGPSARPEVTFSAFILSLATQAADLIGGKSPDLGAAQQVISALEMLHQKTEGRRTEDESRLIDVVLFDLRMAFVGSARGSAK